MKRHSASLAAGFASVFLVSLSSQAGDPSAKDIIITDPVDPWADTIRPISNPTHFDLAIPQTQIHPLFIHNRMPDVVDTILGKVPLGGDYQVYAMQVEVAPK